MSSDVSHMQADLTVGIEVHQQLKTQHKLFCQCPTQLSEKQPNVLFRRRLRPTQSELGQIDTAALFEFHKGRTIVYRSDSETSCLVEMDEEPPSSLNREAVDVGLTVAMLLNAKPVDEIHVMRKIVIDGSNTTGFQRTCVIAVDGSITADGKEVPIQHISLEEDAARKTGESGMDVQYDIDRLGIPLVEIATAPVIHSPEEAQKVALSIGKVLRATKMVKRGLGTIRQDLNISMKDGALVEIKGVQKLELMAKVVECEVQRQLKLLRIVEELRARGVTENDLKDEFHDVTDILQSSACHIAQEAILKGGVVKALLLKGFGGLLKTELQPNVRLGTEFAHRAMYWGRVNGIIHTDELPGYGIEEDDLDKLGEKLNAGDKDAFVLVADTEDGVDEALVAVSIRAKEALRGAPEETRGPNPDGTTRYMRPRPGAARMYPETDVPPTPVTPEMRDRIREKLPPMPDVIAKHLMDHYRLNSKLAQQLINSEFLALFEHVVAQTKVPATFIATVLTETIKSLERRGIPVENLSEEQVEEAIETVDSGLTAKESMEEILSWLAMNPKSSAFDAIDKKNLHMFSEGELANTIERVIAENQRLVERERENAFGKLMKIVMAEVRGRADAKAVSDLIKIALKKSRA